MQDANMKKAPSERELSEKRTEGEKLALFKTLDKGNALSPTRFAGPLTRPDPSVASRHLPTPWGVTLPEGAFTRGQQPLTPPIPHNLTSYYSTKMGAAKWLGEILAKLTIFIIR